MCDLMALIDGANFMITKKRLGARMLLLYANKKICETDGRHPTRATQYTITPHAPPVYVMPSRCCFSQGNNSIFKKSAYTLGLTHTTHEKKIVWA
jgi:hypothetical protein